LRAALPDLLAFSNDPGGVKHAPDWMRGLGVHFVIVPHLPHTYLDGAAFTFEDHPVVALTLRHDRIDSFWFTLLHELAHIVAGHTGLYLDNLDVQNENQAESEANRLARNWLIDPDAFARFVAAHKPYFSRDAVRAFAESQGRHPGIIVGRLHYENLIPYKNLRAWLVKARPHLQAWIDVAEPSWQV